MHIYRPLAPETLRDGNGHKWDASAARPRLSPAAAAATMEKDDCLAVLLRIEAQLKRMADAQEAMHAAAMKGQEDLDWMFSRTKLFHSTGTPYDRPPRVGILSAREAREIVARACDEGDSARVWAVASELERAERRPADAKDEDEVPELVETVSASAAASIPSDYNIELQAEVKPLFVDPKARLEATPDSELRKTGPVPPEGTRERPEQSAEDCSREMIERAWHRALEARAKPSELPGEESLPPPVAGLDGALGDSPLSEGVVAEKEAPPAAQLKALGAQLDSAVARAASAIEDRRRFVQTLFSQQRDWDE